MDKVIAKFKSFEDAEDADLDYYRKLSPSERMQKLFQILEPYWYDGQDSDRLKKVCRIIKPE